MIIKNKPESYIWNLPVHERDIIHHVHQIIIVVY